MPRGGSEQTRQQIETRRKAAETKRAERQAAKQARKRACVHHGKRIGGADVYSPRGVDCCATLACALFGQCTIKRKVAGIAYCKDCERYEARPKKSPVADETKTE